MCTESMAKSCQKCCQVAKISALVYEIDATEKDANIRFRTISRHTAISAHVQRISGHKYKKVYLNKISALFAEFNVVVSVPYVDSGTVMRPDTRLSPST